MLNKSLFKIYDNASFIPKKQHDDFFSDTHTSNLTYCTKFLGSDFVFN